MSDQRGVSFGIDSAWDDAAPERAVQGDSADDLARWWRLQAKDEIDRTVPKAIEYGSTDLVVIGHTLAAAMHREVTDAEAAELGIAFYAHGKMARIMAAITDGRWSSDDSWFDLGVYARMAQRVRKVGYWG